MNVRSQGLRFSSVCTPSAKKNGIPFGLPQLGPTSGIVSPTWRLTYFFVRRATSRPSGSVDSQRSFCMKPPNFASASAASRSAATARSDASASFIGSGSGPRSRTVW